MHGLANDKAVNLKIATVQMRSSLQVDENWRRMATYLNGLADQGVQIVVFPEYSLVPYDGDTIRRVPARQVSAAEERLRQICRNRKIATIIGSIYKVNGRIYNTAVIFDSHGELVERYGKIYLASEPWMTPGNHIAYFNLEGVPSTVMICHDERYPELARLPAIQGARVMYYIAHESGLDEEYKIVPYRAQVMARAVENGMYVVACDAPANPRNYRDSNGHSRIIGPDGNVLKEASMFGEDILIEILEIKPRSPKDAWWSDLSLAGPMGHWWREGLEQMMKNRHRLLE
jgi:predicted amidohydrolase